MTAPATQGKPRPRRRLLTTRDLEGVFGVTAMTVHNWRKGSPKRSPLPVDEESAGRGEVRFAAAITARWAKRNDVTILRPLGEPLLASPQAKPGPKPRPGG